jgi:hypothetical protein
MEDVEDHPNEDDLIEDELGKKSNVVEQINEPFQIL